MKNRIIIMCALAAVVLLSSCSKMNDLHQPYLDKGEKVYAAKVDSVKAFIGVDSQVLEIYLPSQRVAKGLITWNLGADSLEFDITAGANPKTVTIPGLSEGNYTYEIYTYDKYGNVSLPFELTSNVISKATLDNKIEVACKSFYYQKYDEIVGGGVPSGPRHEILIKNAQNFNGAAWFSWEADPAPGATFHIRYLNKSGEWVEAKINGAEIPANDGNIRWYSKLTDAQVEPKDTHKFYYWTTYEGKEVSADISTTIDLGEEYAESIRYFEYSDSISYSVEALTYEEHEDIW